MSDMEKTQNKPLVAIRCITYNHEPYIRDALEGFVMQKTDFPFVAIVHDDASTDNTASIIREYSARYPDIIKPIYETENQYSKHDGSLRRIMDDACTATGAKYIALCEGDDYWTDPLKLQKQVDFLESHPDYSMCFHNVLVHEVDGYWKNDLFDINGSGEYSADQILRKWTVPTCSVMIRGINIFNSPLRSNPHYKFGDNVLFLTAAAFGKIYCIDKKMGVYRRNIGGVTVSTNVYQWRLNLIEHTKGLRQVFKNIVSKNVCNECISENYIYLLRISKGNVVGLIKLFLMGSIDGRGAFINDIWRIWIKPMLKTCK